VKFKDSETLAEGTIQALVMTYYNSERVDYEKFTVFLEKPKTEKINLIEFNLDPNEEVYPKDTPRAT